MPLVVDALVSGAAEGISESASDALSAAYARLRQLVADRFAGNVGAEVALSEYSADPETWLAPLAKALRVTGASSDESVVAAARDLMMLVDTTGARAGRYDVDVHGAQGVQVGDGTHQLNVYNSVPQAVLGPRWPRIRPGQPGNESAFGPVYEVAGGLAVLGEALGEVQQDGPGFVQYFGGGQTGVPSVICALYNRVPVAVAQEIWSELRSVGGGADGGGTVGAGFPAAGQGAFLGSDTDCVKLAGGTWGTGRLARDADGDWRWEPDLAVDSRAYRDQDTWSMRRGEMDLRLRLAARIPVVNPGLRITESGRSRMLAALRGTGLIGVAAALGQRYQLRPGELDWQEIPEPTGYNDTLRAAYEMTVTGPDGRAALRAELWLMLPQGPVDDIKPVVDLSVDFDAARPGLDPAQSPATVPADLKVAVNEIADFFTSAWQAAMTLPLAATPDLQGLPPAGPPHLELYIQNRRPENSGSARTLRTLDMVDFSVFGRTRRTQLTDLSAGITAPLGVSTQQTGETARKALVRMAEDQSFTHAETARI